MSDRKQIKTHETKDKRRPTRHKTSVKEPNRITDFRFRKSAPQTA